MAELDYREFGLRKEESLYTNDYTGTAEQLIAAGFAIKDEFPGEPGRAKVTTRYDVDGKPIPSRRGVQLKERSYRVIRRTGKKFVVEFLASIDEMEVRKAAHDTQTELNHAAWKVQHQEEGPLDAHRAWIERIVKEGPHNATQARDKAVKLAEIFINALSQQVFESTLGAFELDLKEEDCDILVEAFDAIRDVARETKLKRRADLSAEIEQYQLAMGARADTSFQNFLSKALATHRTAGTPGSAMGAQ